MKKQHLNCGSCLYLSRDRIFERKCSELGKLPSAKACNSHSPDAFTLAGSEPQMQRLKLVSKAISGMSLNEVQSLAALLLAEKTTRKAGWSFYQRVIVRYTGNSSSNYFSNFAVGYVVYADKDTVRIVGESGKMAITAMNIPDSDTLYTLERFKALSAEMKRKKQFVDKEISYNAGPRVQPLDDALGSEKPMSRKLSASKVKTDDLVSIIAKMSKGLSIKPAKRSSRKSVNGELTMDWRS